MYIMKIYNVAIDIFAKNRTSHCNMLSPCCGITQQAAQHHTTFHSLSTLPVGKVRELGGKGKEKKKVEYVD